MSPDQEQVDTFMQAIGFVVCLMLAVLPWFVGLVVILEWLIVKLFA